MVTGAHIAGAPAEAATFQEVAAPAPVLMGREAEGRMVTEMGATEDLPLEAQEAPEMEGTPEVREEEVVPLMGVTTTDGEGAATMPTSRRSLAGSWLFTSSRPGEGAALIEKRIESAIGARPSQSRSRPLSRRTSSGSCWRSRKRCEMSSGIIGRFENSSKRRLGTTQPVLTCS